MKKIPIITYCLITILSPSISMAASGQRQNIERFPFFDQTAERTSCTTTVAENPTSYPPESSCTGSGYPNVTNEAKLASTIDDYIRSKKSNSPLVGKGSAIVAAGKQWGVNPALIVNIARKETAWGTTGCSLPNSYNYFCIRRVSGRASIGAWSAYSSPEDAINSAAKLLRTNYIDKGFVSIPAIFNRYAPAADNNNPEEYARQVMGWMQEVATLAGDALACGQPPAQTNTTNSANTNTTQPPANNLPDNSLNNSTCELPYGQNNPGGPIEGVGIVSGERAALNDRLLKNPLFTTDGAINKKDITEGIVTDKLVGLLIAIVEQGKIPIRVSATKSDHDKCTATGSVSNHYSGNAADIGNVDGRDAANGVRLHQFLFNNRGALGLDELIFNPVPAGDSNLSNGVPHVYGSSTMSGHRDHIHVSVNGPKSTSTASAGSSNCN